MIVKHELTAKQNYLTYACLIKLLSTNLTSTWGGEQQSSIAYFVHVACYRRFMLSACLVTYI